MKAEVICVKGKTAALVLAAALLLCLMFTLGYLIGTGRGETQVQITTVQAPEQEPASETPPEQDGPIDLNTATQAQLETLPGVGPELAKRILDYRNMYGRFVSVEQLMDVEGIGEKRFSALEQLVTVR